MFIIKSKPVFTETNATILSNCTIQNSVLYLETESDNFKFENNKWYIKSKLKDEWVFIGVGGNPDYKIENPVILNQLVFDKVFDKN